MAQNGVLRELQGLQWPKTGFYEDCRVCKAPESDSEPLQRSAKLQNQILEDSRALQYAQSRLGAPNPSLQKPI